MITLHNSTDPPPWVFALISCSILSFLMLPSWSVICADGQQPKGADVVGHPGAVAAKVIIYFSNHNCSLLCHPFVPTYLAHCVGVNPPQTSIPIRNIASLPMPHIRNGCLLANNCIRSRCSNCYFRNSGHQLKLTGIYSYRSPLARRTVTA